MFGSDQEKSYFVVRFKRQILKYFPATYKISKKINKCDSQTDN